MGTRADFYIGRGENAEWIGSIAWDGYPDGIPADVTGATSEEAFRTSVAAFFDGRDDATKPSMGWPWPWDDSGTTDFSYAIDGDAVFASCFGSPWWLATTDCPDEPEGDAAVFPDMRSRKATTFGPRSGTITVSI